MKLIDEVLSDPGIDFAEMCREFVRSHDECWHVDRHVLDVDDARTAGGDERSEACAAAMALASRWRREALAPREGLLLSVAYAIVDDEWLAGEAGAPPPHVYVCIARTRQSFRPIEHPETVPKTSSGEPMLDRHLTDTSRLFRLDGVLGEPRGAWIIRGDPLTQGYIIGVRVLVDQSQVADPDAALEGLAEALSASGIVAMRAAQPYWKIEGLLELAVELHISGVSWRPEAQSILEKLGSGWEVGGTDWELSAVCSTAAGGVLRITGAEWANVEAFPASARKPTPG